MSYSEATYYFFGARLTDLQMERADVMVRESGVLQLVCLGDAWSVGKQWHFLACCMHKVSVSDEPLAFDAPPALSERKSHTLRAALETLGVTEQPRWWMGVSRG